MSSSLEENCIRSNFSREEKEEEGSRLPKNQKRGKRDSLYHDKPVLLCARARRMGKTKRSTPVDGPSGLDSVSGNLSIGGDDGGNLEGKGREVLN